MKIDVKFLDGTVHTFESGGFVDFTRRYIQVSTKNGDYLFIPFESVKWFRTAFEKEKEEKCQKEGTSSR